MSGNPSLGDLRFRALKAEARATRKVRLIKQGTYNPRAGGLLTDLNNGQFGVDIAGTEYDVRKGEARINRMTTAQVKRHLERLDKFLYQGTTYYAGARGNIISGDAMRAVRREYKRDNERKREYKKSVAGTFIPWVGITAKEYDEDWRVKKAYLESGSAESLVEYRLPTPRRFSSDEGAYTIAKSMNERQTTRGRNKAISQARQNISEMIDEIGDDRLRRVLDLPDDKLWFMWSNDDYFADRLSRLYWAIHNQDNDKIGKRAIAAILDDYDEKILTLLGMIDEAENLEIKPEKTRKKPRRRKKR